MSGAGWCAQSRMSADVQVFARKILRIWGDLTREDVENEAAVISQVCRSGQSNTVVEVYDNGWLPGFDPSYYYVDMEYCSQTLEEWIHGPSRSNNSEGGRLTTDAVESSLTTAGHETISGYVSEEVLDILQNITSGLKYLHQNGVVHRDLKPRNSIISLQFSKSNISSTLFTLRPALEISRLRHRLPSNFEKIQHNPFFARYLLVSRS